MISLRGTAKETVLFGMWPSHCCITVCSSGCLAQFKITTWRTWYGSMRSRGHQMLVISPCQCLHGCGAIKPVLWKKSTYHIFASCFISPVVLFQNLDYVFSLLLTEIQSLGCGSIWGRRRIKHHYLNRVMYCIFGFWISVLPLFCYRTRWCVRKWLCLHLKRKGKIFSSKCC